MSAPGMNVWSRTGDAMTWIRTIGLAARTIGVLAVAAGWLAMSLTGSAAASQLPQPGTTNELKGVACVSGHDCWAVGTGGEILHWDGSRWTVSSSPAGTGDLTQVACGSANSCWALGSSRLLHFNGIAWKAASVSLPAHTQLATVRCSSATNCFIVGAYGATGRTLALHWSGATWKRVATPNPARGDSLTAVTCLSRTDCWAVGTYQKHGDDFVFAVQWGGSRWRQRWTSTAFLPGVFVEVSMNDVHCISKTNCWAVGSYAASPDGASGVLLHWSSSRSPVDDSVGGPMRSIDCSSSSNCFAVGNSGHYISISSDEALRWNGKHWSEITLPAGGSGGGTDLWGVSCIKSRACWAVGDDHFFQSNLALEWDGRHWNAF
jgi:hypothetical protein